MFQKGSGLYLSQCTLSKKGQVTLFMILGIVLLILIFSGYYIFSVFMVDAQEPLILEANIPQTPLEEFIQSCIRLSTEEAIQRLGEQGGYVQMPDEVSRNTRRSITVDPQRNYAIPYWYYQTNSYIPSVPDMEKQVADFIVYRLPFCLGDFDLFALEVQTFDVPKARVTFLPEIVAVTVEYELQARNVQVTSRKDSFTFIYEAAILETIESAQRFAREIYDSYFFEDFTINLMAIADPVIPMSNIKFSCESPTWSKAQVSDDLRDLLYYTVPSIRVKGAEHSLFDAPIGVYEELQRVSPDDFISGRPFGDIPADTYEYAHAYFQSEYADEFTSSNTIIYTRYLPDYGMYFQARPSQGDRMFGSTMRGSGRFLNFFCMHMYHFTYDVSYPIEINVMRQDALNGRPFNLKFAVPVVINHNQPERVGGLDFSIFDNDRMNSEICSDTAQNPTTFIARDYVSGLDIPEVKVEYNCVRHYCDLGETWLDESGRVLLRTHLPAGCFGGLVEVSRDGYVSQQRQIDETQMTHEFDLVPLQRLPFIVALGPNRAGVTPTGLRPGQSAVVILDDLYSDYEGVFGFDGELFSQSQVQTIEVIRGMTTEYNVTVLVYDEESLLAAVYGGVIRVGPAELASGGILFYTREYIPRLVGEDILQAYQDMENATLMQEYMPRWN